ncbi:hypothetical protein GH714_020423 [Hevea brasiliensis]|uniref:Uncharacterized protein n=1 Tax=Hevea brasiliensis TaxID=3981 RepID=A0A6A6KUM4_HEVBR|nr:hypothetical protein GH714_020423 [Hevea brasiliensis]
MEKVDRGDASNQIEHESKELTIVDNIPEDLKILISETALWPELCIYRVPRKLRAINPVAYTHQLISIGPFHSKDEALKSMEKQKLRYLAEFCIRTGINWTELANQIKVSEVSIRHCYEETFDEVYIEDFVKMILLDSVFIIELFLRRRENIISIEILKMILNSENQHANMVCFCCLRDGDQSAKKEDEEGGLNQEKPINFTDLARKSRSFKLPVSRNDNTVMKVYNATMLREAGVKFKASSEAWLIDMKFERGVLKMLRFLANDDTERVIRNLMAFEQCYHPNEPLICDYIWILDFLINTEKDVDLLVEKGIIVNLLGDSKTATNLVNNLGLEIRASGSCFYGLNNHYDSPGCRTVAIMRSVCFSNLW